jgi:hypothetical protein
MKNEEEANNKLAIGSHISKKETMQSRIRGKGKVKAKSGNCVTEIDGFQRAFQLARKRAEIEAQHGPVKILYKDGKPIE